MIFLFITLLIQITELIPGGVVFLCKVTKKYVKNKWYSYFSCPEMFLTPHMEATTRCHHRSNMDDRFGQ